MWNCELYDASGKTESGSSYHPCIYIVTGQTSDEDPRSDKIVLGQIMIYLKYLEPGQFTILGPTGVTNVPNDQWKTAQNY